MGKTSRASVPHTPSASTHPATSRASRGGPKRRARKDANFSKDTAESYQLSAVSSRLSPVTRHPSPSQFPHGSKRLIELLARLPEVLPRVGAREALLEGRHVEFARVELRVHFVPRERRGDRRLRKPAHRVGRHDRL